MTDTQNDVDLEQRIVTMSGVTHDVKSMELKINYFVDSLKLLCESQGLPLFDTNLNARLFCRILYNLIQSDTSYKYKYILHYYENYKYLISTTSHINKPFKEVLTILDNELKAMGNPFQLKTPFDSTNLFQAIEKSVLELDKNYVSYVVDELIKTIFCPEDLFKHNHIDLIEVLANELIIEFRAIDYSNEKIKDVFDDAIKVSFIDIDSLGRQELLNLPVPSELFIQQKTLSFTKYKNKVKKHVKTGGLQNQLENLKYIFSQSPKKTNFVFKIKDLTLLTTESFSYNGVKFARSLEEKYTHPKFYKLYNDFYKPNDKTTFCEVSAYSGTSFEALQKAIKKVQEGLNFLEYNLGYNSGQIRRPTLDLSFYIIVSKYPSYTGRNTLMRLAEKDLRKFSYLYDLEKLSANKMVSKYLNIDKIFFGAFNGDTDYDTISQLWRYCEALFIDENKSPDTIIKKLVSYYIKKAPHQIYAGTMFMMMAYNRSLHRTGRDKIPKLGLTVDEFIGSYSNRDVSYKEYLKIWNKIIPHPLINRMKNESFSYQAGTIQHKLREHYTKILKSANIQRNLYQHSNITIEEIKNIWNNEFVQLVGSLRMFLIEDLKRNTEHKRIEDIFL